MSATIVQTLTLADGDGDAITFTFPGEDGVMSVSQEGTAYVKLEDEDLEALEAFCRNALNRARDGDDD